MTYLQIGSWNIEHLSGASREDQAQSSYALTDHVEMSGIDVLALQEIYVTHEENGERRNMELDRVCELLQEHEQGAWQYSILDNRNAGDTSQLCAVMWNGDRVTLAETRKLPVEHNVDGDALWDRAPHAVKFTTELPVWRNTTGEWVRQNENRSLVVVPIHMKSNFGGVTVNRRKRAKEARTLCDNLHVASDMDPSIVIIGDTNCLDANEPAIETFIDAGLIDLNNNDSATYWSREYGESPFDRAFVAKDRDEFAYSRQYVLRSSDLGKHDRFLSDHYMIKLSVKSYVDDKDPRNEA